MDREWCAPFQWGKAKIVQGSPSNRGLTLFSTHNIDGGKKQNDDEVEAYILTPLYEVKLRVRDILQRELIDE
jgi:hypothetical protein